MDLKQKFYIQCGIWSSSKAHSTILHLACHCCLYKSVTKKGVQKLKKHNKGLFSYFCHYNFIFSMTKKWSDLLFFKMSHFKFLAVMFHLCNTFLNSCFLKFAFYHLQHQNHEKTLFFNHNVYLSEFNITTKYMLLYILRKPETCSFIWTN